MIMNANEILKVKRNFEEDEMNKAINNTKTSLMDKISNELLRLAQTGQRLSKTYKIKEETCGGTAKYLYFYDRASHYKDTTYYARTEEKYDFKTLKQCLEEKGFSFVIEEDTLVKAKSYQWATCKNLIVYIEED